MPHEHFSFILFIIGQKRNLRFLVSFHSPYKRASHLHYFPMDNGPCLLEQVATKLPRFGAWERKEHCAFASAIESSKKEKRRKVFLHLGRQNHSDFTLFAPSISYIGFPSTLLILLRPYTSIEQYSLGMQLQALIVP